MIIIIIYNNKKKKRMVWIDLKEQGLANDKVG
jgi:hypothetical protein